MYHSKFIPLQRASISVPSYCNFCQNIPFPHFIWIRLKKAFGLAKRETCVCVFEAWTDAHSSIYNNTHEWMNYTWYNRSKKYAWWSWTVDDEASQPVESQFPPSQIHMPLITAGNELRPPPSSRRRWCLLRTFRRKKNDDGRVFGRRDNTVVISEKGNNPTTTTHEVSSNVIRKWWHSHSTHATKPNKRAKASMQSLFIEGMNFCQVRACTIYLCVVILLLLPLLTFSLEIIIIAGRASKMD